MAKMWRNPSLHTAGGNGKWFSRFETQSGGSSAKHRVTVWPNSATPGYLPRRNQNTRPHKDSMGILIAALFIKAKTWKQAKGTNTLWSDRTMEYYSAIQRMKCWYTLQHGWTLKALCWVKGSSHKSTYCTIPFVWNICTREIHRDTQEVSACSASRIGG